jgi:hypothetical protein
MHIPNPVLTEPQLDSMFADFKDVSHRFDAYLNKDGTKGYQRAYCLNRGNKHRYNRFQWCPL